MFFIFIFWLHQLKTERPCLAENMNVVDLRRRLKAAADGEERGVTCRYHSFVVVNYGNTSEAIFGSASSPHLISSLSRFQAKSWLVLLEVSCATTKRAQQGLSG